MTESNLPDEPQPLVIHDRQRQRLSRGTWALLGLIVLFFAIGLALVATGLLVPDPNDTGLPGPTAFTLTPIDDPYATPLP